MNITALVITFCRFEIFLKKKSGKIVTTGENWEVVTVGTCFLEFGCERKER